MNDHINCEATAVAIAEALRAGSPASLSPAALDHLSHCQRCRAGLLHMLRELAAHSARAADPRACAPCQTDIAKFLELERTDPARARTLYPQVWEHLWLCAACFDAYLMGQPIGADPEEQLALAEASPGAQNEDVIQRIRLTRKSLDAVLPPDDALRSHSSEGFVVFDHSDGEPPRQVTVVLREQRGGHWQMQVSVAPQIDAILLLSIGTKSFAARFSAGRAQIEDIPGHYVTDDGAPDMDIALLYPTASKAKD